MAKKSTKTIELENLLEEKLKESGLGGYVRPFKIEGLPYVWDFAYPSIRLLIEVNGGTWVKGGHSTGAGIARDYRKLNAATVAGYKSLLFDGNMVRDDTASAVIAEAILAGTEPAKE